VTIEETLAKLQDVTAKLDRDDVPLEEAIGLFEQGLTLAASVKEQLEAAKLRIEQVLEETKGTFSLDVFDAS